MAHLIITRRPIGVTQTRLIYEWAPNEPLYAANEARELMDLLIANAPLKKEIQFYRDLGHSVSVIEEAGNRQPAGFPSMLNKA